MIYQWMLQSTVDAKINNGFLDQSVGANITQMMLRSISRCLKDQPVDA